MSEQPQARPMTAATVHRRGFLGTAAAVLAAGSTQAASPPPLPEGHIAICREIRRRLKDVRRLIGAEMAIEGEPGHAAAEATAVAAEHAFNCFCDDLIDLPISGWPDVVVRAEVARAMSQFTILGLPSACDPSEGNDREVEALGHLLSAVVKVGGVGGLEIDV